GVMLAASVRDYLVNYGVSVGDRTVVVTNNDDAYRTAIALTEAGLTVPAILDARVLPQDSALMTHAKDLGIRVMMGHAVARVTGGKRVTGVEVCSQAGEGAVLETFPCDAVAMSGGWSPVVHLWSHCGGKLTWDTAGAMFRPDVNNPPLGADGHGFVTAAGAAGGFFALDDILHDAHAAADGVVTTLGFKLPADAVSPNADRQEEAPLAPVWMMPQGANVKLREKTWLDYQNDVKVSDVRLAAQEGFVSVEHAKRYTTLGMATDQGKLSNINGLAT
ncbi:MAG TPA: sarcosine oxidase subunit alpha family protein, partial [Sulfitobacter pontiacus]|nr:sarcosine oxidase subunit alpha family protein [Sulfitobacter pontiacus]